MARAPSPITCLPENLLPEIQCLICGRSKLELLQAFDSFLCEALLLDNCTVSSLLPLARPYMDWSPRELVGASTYLWGVFLSEESPGTDISEQALGPIVSPFLNRSEIEILAMQLWLLCQYGDATCDANSLFDRGRCYCVSIKDLLAIRVYLLGQFVGNFVLIDMTPAALLAKVIENVGRYTITSLEAVTAWTICELYNVAVQNQQPV